MARNYSNIALDTTLTAGIGAGDLTCVVTSAADWPAVPFAAVLDPGSVTSEEVVQVTNVAGTTFTITRGFDGTTAAAHALGATVRHAAIAGDFTDLQAADGALTTAIANEASARATADALRLLIASYDWSTLPNKPSFGALALLNSITASLISDASADGRSLITAANYAAMRTLLSLVVGTDVQAFDADLAAIAALASAADKLPYATGPQAWALTGLSAYIRTLLDDVDATTARATLDAAKAVARARPKLAGVAYPTLPGVVAGTVAAVLTGAAQIRYYPVIVDTPITVDQIAVEVNSAGAGGTTARLGIYNADTDWQPTTLVLDAGTVAVDSNGYKAISINQALSAGRYLLAYNSDGAPTLRTIRGSLPGFGLDPVLGASAFITALTVASALATFATPGAAWTAAPLGTTPAFGYAVALRVSAP